MPCNQAPRPWLIGTSGKVSGCSRICVHGCHSTARSRARQSAASASIVGSAIVMSRHDLVPSPHCPLQAFPCRFRLHPDRGSRGGGDSRHSCLGGGAAVDGPPRRGTRGAGAGRCHRYRDCAEHVPARQLRIPEYRAGAGGAGQAAAGRCQLAQRRLSAQHSEGPMGSRIPVSEAGSAWRVRCLEPGRRWP